MHTIMDATLIAQYLAEKISQIQVYRIACTPYGGAILSDQLSKRGEALFDDANIRRLCWIHQRRSLNPSAESRERPVSRLAASATTN